MTAEASRGAVSLIAAARVTLVLNRMDKDEAQRFGISEDKERRRLFAVQDDKANRAPAEDAQWFRLASQDVGNATGQDDPFGLEGDSVGVVTRWTPPDAFEGLSADHLLRVQRVVADGAWKESIQAKDWVGHAVAQALNLDASKGEKTDRARINSLVKIWISTGALVVVERRDPEKRENKPFVEVGEWADRQGAPPSGSGAGKVGQGGASEAPRPTSPLIGEVGGAPMQGGSSRWGGAAASAPAKRHLGGNPALGAPKEFSRWEKPNRGIILAPGETGDEPLEDWP